MKKAFHLLTLVLCLFAAMPWYAAAQSHSVTVRVSDAGGPLAGAGVLVKGTSTGAVTAPDGTCTLPGVTAATVLEISSLGYVTQEVTVGSQHEISVILVEDSELLDEIVVVGYGVQKKESLTSAITQISSEALETSKSVNTTEALQGKVPGLLIRNRTGKPGEFATDLSLRGYGTPMIVVDGVVRSGLNTKRVVEFGPFGGPKVQTYEDFSAINEINPNDIESISVLKDASATIYGLGAENGVILITTKKGKAGKPKVSLQADLSLNSPTRVTDYMGWGSYMRYANAMADIGRKQHIYSDEQIAAYENGDPSYQYIDWMDLTQNKFAVSQRYNATVSGGNDRVRYYVGLGYNNEGSTMKSDYFKYQRYNINASFTANLTKDLEFRYTSSIRITDSLNPGSIGSERNIWYFSMVADPDTPPYVKDNPTHYTYMRKGGTPNNPLALLDPEAGGYSSNWSPQFQNTVDVTYHVPFVKGLTLSATGAYDFQFTQNNTLEKQYATYDYDTDQFVDWSSQQDNYIEMWMNNRRLYGRIQATYDNTFGKHHVGATVAAETTSYKYAYATARRYYGTTKDDSFYTHDTIDSGLSSTQTNSGSRSQSVTAGYIGRITYDYAGKYLAEVMARYDGSYIYAPGHRWGFFPSYSLGWRVSEEPFIKDNLPWLNNLKLRWSDGKTGSVQGSPYAYVGGYTNAADPMSGIAPTYVFDPGSSVKAWSNTAVENTILTWADVRMMDAGIDWEVKQGLFGGSFDRFRREVNGLAAYRSISLPDFYGVSLPQENLNVKEDVGLELALSHRNHIGAFNYSVMASATFTRSRYTYIESEKDHKYRSHMDYWKTNQLNRWMDGRAGTYYGWSGGQFTSLDDISNTGILYSLGTTTGGNNALVPGMYKMVDRNGNGYIDDDDVFYTWGDDLNPPLQYGLNINADYKGIDLRMTFAGSAMRYRAVNIHGYAGFGYIPHLSEGYADSYHVTEYGADPWDPATQWTAGYWPALVAVDDPMTINHNGTYAYNQPYNYVNAAFLRLKNIELGYTLSGRFLSKAGISSLRAYVNGGNLLTFSNKNLRYSDPESDDQSAAGGTFPLMKSYTFGLNINF